MTTPRLSIIIPTLNRPSFVRDTVSALQPEMAAIGAECIVVDQSDSNFAEETRAALAPLAGVRYHHLDVQSLPNARNVGAALGRSEIVLFLDDDVVPDVGLLREHLAALEDATIGGVAGRITEARAGRNRNTDSIGTWMSWYGRVFRNYDGDRACDVLAPPGGNMSFRVAAMRAAGPFDVNYRGNATLEETDYGYRVRAAGWRIRFAPAAHLVHLAAPAGGCRVDDPLSREFGNFRNLTRFYLTHKTRWLFPVFVAASLLSILRRLRARVPVATIVRTFGRAIVAGVRSYRTERVGA